MTKTLLMVSGGIQAVHGIRRAKEMGCHVVVSDIDPAAPGFAVGDDALHASTYDVEATIAAALRYHRTRRPIDGVLSVGADVPRTLAGVAARLGLPGIPLEAAELAADKLLMKQRFAADGVPVPWFAPVHDRMELKAHIRARGRVLVIKPVDSRGGRGVLRLTPDVNLGWAFATAKAHSPSGRVMVEEYLPGPQISTESLVLDGVAHTPGFSDRNYEFLDVYAPYFIENGGELPSQLPAATQAMVRELVTAAAASLGIRNGVLKGDIVISDGKPHVIEMATRLSGGFFCTLEIPLNTGVDFVGQAIRLALGEPVDPADLVPRFQRPVVQRYLWPKPGRITAIQGLEEARALPGVAEIVLSRRVGDIVPVPTASPASVAMVIATGASRPEAQARAEAAVAALRVETVAP